ncbi:MAG: hypothetical protein PHW73_01780 [Atribacterota bacterium]|nr:hypothetical protein [Atribacterota bacterium]
MISEKDLIDFFKDNKFEGDFVDDANYITSLTPEDLAKAIIDKIKGEEAMTLTEFLKESKVNNE